MEKEKKRRISLVLILAIVVIFIIILIISKLGETSDEDNLPDEEPIDLEGTEFTEIDSTVQRVSIRNNYYYVKNSVVKFYSLLDEEMIENSGDEYISEYLYSLLADESISYSGITLENVMSKFETTNNATIIVTDMLVSQRTFDISLYFVYGKIRSNGTTTDFSIMLKVDRTNDTFKIYLDDYMNNNYPNLQIGDTIEFEDDTNVESNEYNIFEYKTISDDTHAENLYLNIKYYLLYDNESLYEMLDEEYKSQFSSYQAFYDYITDNFLQLLRMSYGSYNKTTDSDEETFVIIDSEDEITITVYETDPFEYTLTLSIE